jgi:hypothetical protein
MKASMRRFTALVVAGIITAAGLMVSAEPVVASGGSYRYVAIGADQATGLTAFQIKVNEGTNTCLDSGFQLAVYLNPCAKHSDFNDYQLWYIWNGGWTRNVKTGYCLTSPYIDTLGTDQSCVEAGWGAQLWTHWEHGWYQGQAYTDSVYHDARRLSRTGQHTVTTIRCVNPNGPNPPTQEWFTWDPAAHL